MPKGIKSFVPLEEEVLTQVAERFKVLSEPIRLRILQSLMKEERTVTQIVTEVQSSQPNVSKHLGMLFQANIIQKRQRGTSVLYSIKDPAVFELCGLICNQLRKDIQTKAKTLL